MSLVLVIIIAGFGNLDRPLLWRPPAESTNSYFDPYPPDEILPTPLPNEWSCWGCCCLFPGIGGYLGYKFFKEKPDQAIEKCLSIGMSYGLGSVLDGIGHPTQSAMPDPIVELEKAIYWVNRAHMNLGFCFRPSLELEIGLGYMWGSVNDRFPVFECTIEGHTDPVGYYWEMAAISPVLAIKFLRKRDKFFTVGLEWLFVRGINRGFADQTPVTVVIKDNALGGYLGFGLSPRLTSFLQLEFSITGRCGLIRDPDYWGVEEEVVRSEDFFISFSGLYLNLGIEYKFLTMKGG